jgi:DNA invertase Pin-like site-specific DNA recombinase
MMKTKYVAYYRVSSKLQGISGAGLDAQKKDVMHYTKGNVCAEYYEIESGANNERPVLDMAIRFAKMNDATLVIAKLDRLSRDVKFIFELRDAGVKFVCCDMPEMNTLNVGIISVMAQHERELISERTRKAIRTKIDAGKKWGNPQNFSDISRAKGRDAHAKKARNNGNNMRAFLVASDLRKNGVSFAVIAQRLNDFGFVTSRGCKFHPNSVKQLCNVMNA